MNRMIDKNDDVMIYIMQCANGIRSGVIDYPAVEARYGAVIKKITVPCSGKVDLLYLVKAFETGADGVVLLSCPPAQCRHLEGNLRSMVRAGSVNSLLEESGVEGERVAVIAVDNNDPGKTLARINDFISELKNMNQTCVLSA